MKIFNYISNLDDYEYAFDSLTRELIDKEIDFPKIIYVNLNDITLINYYNIQEKIQLK